MSHPAARPGNGVTRPAGSRRARTCRLQQPARRIASGFAAAVLAGVAVAALPAPTLAQASSAAATGEAMAIEFDRRVAMRDGVELSADVYRPRRDGRYPVVLVRTPYVKAGRGTLEQARRFAERGYVLVRMDVRGRGDSDGEFVPYRNDGDDGYDAIEWAAAEPWSDGRVATMGNSYEAGLQWLTAIRQPPHLAAMVSLVPVGDPGTDIFITGPTGLPTPTMLSWYHLVDGHVAQNMEAVDWAAMTWHLPMTTMDDAIGRPHAYWDEHLKHPGGAAWWDAQRYQHRLDDVRVPVLHITGWYDDVQGPTLLNFRRLTAGPGGPPQSLLVGPWGHRVNTTRRLGDIDFGPDALIDLDGAILRWLDHHVKGLSNGVADEPPVRLFRMGDGGWFEADGWPLPGTEWRTYHLRSGGRANSLYGDGRLTTEVPGDEPADRYSYDPARPVPFITDAEFSQIGGPDDYRPVERRDDVLVYTGDPLPEPLLVCGPVRVRLFAASSAPDTDFMAKLIDVHPDGYAQRLTDGAVRARYREDMATGSLIEPGRVYEYDIDLWSTCQTFLPGHRIRLEIASSAFPKYPRNLNTAEPPGSATRMEVAEQTIHHDRARPSAVILPVVMQGGSGSGEVAKPR